MRRLPSLPTRRIVVVVGAAWGVIDAKSDAVVIPGQPRLVGRGGHQRGHRVPEVALLFSSYAPYGEGLVFLFVLFVGGSYVVSAAVMWSILGFRAPPFPSFLVRNVAWSGMLLLLLTLCSFPPTRRAGNWKDANGQTPASAMALRLDRDFYGYIPAWQWVGNTGQVIDPGWSISKDGFTAASYRRVVDWQYILIEAVILVLLLLPFLRAGVTPPSGAGPGTGRRCPCAPRPDLGGRGTTRRETG